MFLGGKPEKPDVTLAAMVDKGTREGNMFDVYPYAIDRMRCFGALELRGYSGGVSRC